MVVTQTTDSESFGAETSASGFEFDSENAVQDWQQLDIKAHPRHGTTALEIVRMDDGTTYEVVLGEPLERKTDIPVVSTPALGTSIRGHNTRSLYHAMDLGYPAILVGAEGGHREGLVPKLPHRHKLVQTAHNMHQILDKLATPDIVLTGESRGAMLAFGLYALAAEHQRNVVYSDIVAPCFAEGFSLKDMPDYIRSAARELPAMGRFIGSLSFQRLVHYPNSLNPSPTFLMQTSATLMDLASGEAGILAQHVPKDAQMHIQVFSGDFAGQGERWQEIFGQYPGVVISEVAGGHLSIVEADTRFNIDSRLKGLVDELIRTADEYSKIDFGNVHLNIRAEAC